MSEAAERLIAGVIRWVDELDRGDYHEPEDENDSNRMAVAFLIKTVCTELGITPEMVAEESGRLSLELDGCDDHFMTPPCGDRCACVHDHAVASVLATLVEVAGQAPIPISVEGGHG